MGPKDRSPIFDKDIVKISILHSLQLGILNNASHVKPQQAHVKLTDPSFSSRHNLFKSQYPHTVMRDIQVCYATHAVACTTDQYANHASP